MGGAWRSFNEFRHRMESEVRNTMPDLPSTSEIARLARSPSALLNHLSTMSSDDEEPATAGQVTASTVDGPVAAGANGAGAITGEGVEATVVAGVSTEGTEPSAGAERNDEAAEAGPGVAPVAGMNGTGRRARRRDRVDRAPPHRRRTAGPPSRRNRPRSRSRSTPP